MLRDRARQWRHVFKLDPNRRLSEAALELICQSDTDAVVVGGTDGITYRNTAELLGRIRRYPVECVLEVRSKESIVPGFDGYLIPVVLNTDDARWIKGAHFEVIRQFGAWIPWDLLLVQGYVILNPDSRVARLTASDTALDVTAVTSYARLAENLFQLPVCYIEYSGTKGDPDMVRAARKGLSRTRLFYGGGITNEERARTMAKWADTVVVGNLVYQNVEQAVRTVSWVKETVVL